jgi:hypothetical protein
VPHVLKQLFRGDEALFDQRSHWDVDFFSGTKLPQDFRPPVQFSLDLDSEGRHMPTFFTTPAFVARKSFYELLAKSGVDNIDPVAATIINDETGELVEDYYLLNILGRYSCADLQANPGIELGPGIRVLDEPILSRAAKNDALIFRLAEDPIQIIVADKIALVIRAANLEDVYLSPVSVTA